MVLLIVSQVDVVAVSKLSNFLLSKLAWPTILGQSASPKKVLLK